MLKRKSAFTLIEILLVTAMVSVISIAVFHAFANGLKLWAKGEHLVIESDISIFFDKFGEDLRGVQKISTIPFKGITSHLSFPTTVLTKADERGARSEEGIVDQLGAVQYSYNPADKKIIRSQANYSQATKNYWPIGSEAATGVEDFTLRYYFLNDRKEQMKTQTDEGIPSGVMADIQYSDGGKERHMRRYFPIPVGGGL